MTSHTIRSTIAAKMGKEVPNWLSKYNQGLADIKSVEDQHKKEEAEAARESFAKLANKWKPLQNEALRLTNSWQKLEVDRIFSDVAEHVFNVKISFPKTENGPLPDESNCIIIKDRAGKEILLIEAKGRRDLTALYWQAFDRSGKRITYHDWSTREIKDCLAKLQQERGYDPNDLVLSHIERNVERAIPHSGEAYDPRSWISWVPVGELIMDSAIIKCDYFDVEVPIAEIQDPKDLEKRLDEQFAQRLKRDV